VSQSLIAALQNPALYPHPVEAFQVIETHISWVVLTGPYAYKLKKPMNFGFLDFTDLEKRGLMLVKVKATGAQRAEIKRTTDIYRGQIVDVSASVYTVQLTGDYQGLEVLNFYKAYRALVRAKIALFSMPSEASPVQRATTLRQYRNYANLAESYSTIPSRFLAITHGVSAVGKSHVSMRLVEALGAVRLRSDVERKRLFGEQHVENTPQAGIYAADASAATYARLNEIADTVLRAGYPVVLDATFLKREQRDAAAKVAEATGAPFLILDCNAPQAVIASWLAQRQADKNDPSDATLTIIEEQQANRDPLTAEELRLSKRVETNESGTLDALVAHIRQRLPGL
jgi:hypothetical protein